MRPALLALLVASLAASAWLAGQPDADLPVVQAHAPAHRAAAALKPTPPAGLAATSAGLPARPADWLAPGQAALLAWPGCASSMRSSLQTLRAAIDQYTADKGHYPDNLDALVAGRYLRDAPEDPLTGRRDSWVLLAPAPDSLLAGGVWDVRSGAAGRRRDAGLCADW